MCKKEKKICSIGIWDESVPGITFDKDNVSNYAKIQQKLSETYPRGEKGLLNWEEIIKNVSIARGNGKYDCVVGVSGGVDSSYLLYILKIKYGLNPLAVTLDNGWNTDVAVGNIKTITNALNIDLETFVIDYEEIKDLLRSYMYACIPWIDIPTDVAIKSVMYKIALRENVKYIFRGNDFRSEGKQPREWTYSDNRQLRYIHKKFGKLKKLKSYPYLPFRKIIYAGFIRGIKDIRPFYYLDYNKSTARSFLENEYGWKYYGGHHHENLFTKFAMSVWLPEKFGIDKRIINLSAQIVSGQETREKALLEISKPAINEKIKLELVSYVLKKLDLSEKEYATIIKQTNKTYRDYPNYEKFLFFILKYLQPMIQLVYSQKPMTFVEMEVNSNNKEVNNKI